MQVTWPFILGKPMLAKLRARIESRGNEPRFTPEEVAEACHEFLNEFVPTHGGGGHITLADNNNESHHIAFCIRTLVEELGTDQDFSNLEVIHFLGCILELDDEERVFGRDYVDEDWPESASSN